MSKIMSLQAAVSSLVHDGDSICIGGCTTNRKPYALVREIIRQGKRNLYLHGAASGGDADMLIGVHQLLLRQLRLYQRLPPVPQIRGGGEDPL